MENKAFQTHHHKDIAEFLQCSPELANEVYNIMRYDIFHSPMDWVPLDKFNLAIVDAVSLLHKYRLKTISKGEEPLSLE